MLSKDGIAIIFSDCVVQNYENDDSEHDYRVEHAEEIINGWIERDLFHKLGRPKNVYDLMIQLDLRGY